MLGIAVSTIKYLVELRGWNGVALPMIHSRDARIYIEVRRLHIQAFFFLICSCY